MGNRIGIKQIASPKNPADQRNDYVTPQPRGSSQGILVQVFFLFLALLAGCSGASTPLYYTAKSSIPPQTLPNVQSQPQEPAQMQMQSRAPAQLSQPVQPSASHKDLQQQLLLQAASLPPTRYKDYRVGPEDLLFIDVYGQDALKRELRVSGQGEISMPLVGVINVGGLTTQEIEKRLMEGYGSQYLRNPQITVEVKEFHHQRVAVTGAVAKPGYYDIIGPRSLLEVLSMAGGLSVKESGDVINVIQRTTEADSAKNMKTASGNSNFPNTRTTVINIQRLVSGQSPDLNLMVKNGDVVYVPFAGTAYVLGGVKKPGNVMVKDNLTVSQAVSTAQGVDPLYGTYKLIIMRFDEQGRPIKIDADLKKIMAGEEQDIPVKENDAIVVVEGDVKRKLWVIRQILPIPGGGYSIPTH